MSIFQVQPYAGLSSDARETFRDIGQRFLAALAQQPSLTVGLAKPYGFTYDQDADKDVLNELEEADILCFDASPNQYLLSNSAKLDIARFRDDFA